MSKREKIALGLAIAAIAWFFIENCYFGWHLTATSTAENTCDSIVVFLLVLAYFIKPVSMTIYTKNLEIKKASVGL